ncbi:hypothetical protein ABT369_25790 [Dactylosporangium sp. NPDC000244]|uniref:hypothetical protein n=1 Tax=Dactylosporangium sp. NPDC000244 TaxID=3154365 RepID=UPI003328A11F
MAASDPGHGTGRLDLSAADEAAFLSLADEVHWHRHRTARRPGRAPAGRAGDFVRHLVTTGRRVRDDLELDGYALYRAMVGGRTVLVRARVGDDGAVTAARWSTALDNHLTSTVDELVNALRADRWTIVASDAADLDRDARQVRVPATGDAEAALRSMYDEVRADWRVGNGYDVFPDGRIRVDGLVLSASGWHPVAGGHLHPGSGWWLSHDGRLARLDDEAATMMRADMDPQGQRIEQTGTGLRVGPETIDLRAATRKPDPVGLFGTAGPSGRSGPRGLVDLIEASDTIERIVPLTSIVTPPETVPADVHALAPDLFKTPWLGVTLTGTTDGELVFEQGSRQLSVRVEDGERVELIAPDSLAALTGSGPQRARLLVPPGTPAHVVAAELAGAVVGWFAATRWSRLGSILWRREDPDALRDTPAPATSTLSPADRGRWAAALVLARHAAEHEATWTAADETELIGRLAAMGLLGGQAQAPARRRLLAQLGPLTQLGAHEHLAELGQLAPLVKRGVLNAFGRRLLERAWDTSHEVAEAKVLDRIDLALSALERWLPSLRGGQTHVSAGGGRQLRLLTADDTIVTVPVVLVDRRPGIPMVRHDGDRIVVRTDASVEALQAGLAPIVAGETGADPVATGRMVQLNQYRSEPAEAVRTMLRHRRRQAYATDRDMVRDEAATPPPKPPSGAPGPPWWAFTGGRVLSGIGGMAAQTVVGVQAHRPGYIFLSQGAAGAVSNPLQGIVDKLFDHFKRKHDAAGPGFRPDRLADPAKLPATVPHESMNLAIDVDEQRTSLEPSLFTYELKFVPPPAVGGAIAAAVASAAGGSPEVAGVTFALNMAAGAGWGASEKIADGPSFKAADRLRQLQRKLPESDRLQAVTSAYYLALELTKRLTGSAGVAPEVIASLSRAHAELTEFRESLQADVSRRLAQLRWRRANVLPLGKRPPAQRRNDAALRADGERRRLGQVPAVQWIARKGVPSTLSASVGPIVVAVAGGHDFGAAGAIALSTFLSAGLGRGVAELQYLSATLDDSWAIQALDTLNLLTKTIALIDPILRGVPPTESPEPALLENHGIFKALYRQHKDDLARGRPSDHSARMLVRHKHLPQLAGRLLAMSLSFGFAEPVTAATVGGTGTLVQGALGAGEILFRKVANGQGRLVKDRAFREYTAKLALTPLELADRIATSSAAANIADQAGRSTTFTFRLDGAHSFWRRRVRKFASRTADGFTSGRALLVPGPAVPGTRLTHADRLAADRLAADLRRLSRIRSGQDDAHDLVATQVTALARMDALGLLVRPRRPGEAAAADGRWRLTRAHLTAVRALKPAQFDLAEQLRRLASTAGTMEAELAAAGRRRPDPARRERLLDAVWRLAGARGVEGAWLTPAGTVRITLTGGRTAELHVTEAAVPTGVAARITLAADDLLHAVLGRTGPAPHAVTVDEAVARDPQRLTDRLLDVASAVAARTSGRRGRIRRLAERATPEQRLATVDEPPGPVVRAPQPLTGEHGVFGTGPVGLRNGLYFPWLAPQPSTVDAGAFAALPSVEGWFVLALHSDQVDALIAADGTAWDQFIHLVVDSGEWKSAKARAGGVPNIVLVSCDPVRTPPAESPPAEPVEAEPAPAGRFPARLRTSLGAARLLTSDQDLHQLRDGTGTVQTPGGSPTAMLFNDQGTHVYPGSLFAALAQVDPAAPAATVPDQAPFRAAGTGPHTWKTTRDTAPDPVAAALADLAAAGAAPLGRDYLTAPDPARRRRALAKALPGLTPDAIAHLADLTTAAATTPADRLDAAVLRAAARALRNASGADDLTAVRTQLDPAARVTWILAVSNLSRRIPHARASLDRLAAALPCTSLGPTT